MRNLELYPIYEYIYIEIVFVICYTLLNLSYINLGGLV